MQFNGFPKWARTFTVDEEIAVVDECGEARVGMESVY